MSILHLILGLVAAQRVAELLLARRNTVRLLASGAHEVGRRHYPLFVALHTGWLLAMLAFVPGDAPPLWGLLALFLLLQACRLWVLAALGPFWTTRVITLPGAPWFAAVRTASFGIRTISSSRRKSLACPLPSEPGRWRWRSPV